MGRLAADWTGPTPEPEPEVVEVPELATVTDLKRYRSVKPAEVEPYHPTAEDFDLTPDELEARREARQRMRDNEINEHTLKASNRAPGASGSGDKGIKKPMPPLKPLERIAKRERGLKFEHGGAYDPETDEQRAARESLDALKAAERAHNRLGRPRKGKEKREVISARVDPITPERLKSVGLILGDMADATAAWLSGNGPIPNFVLNKMTENIRKSLEQEKSENSLTDENGTDMIAA